MLHAERGAFRQVRSRVGCSAFPAEAPHSPARRFEPCRGQDEALDELGRLQEALGPTQRPTRGTLSAETGGTCRRLGLAGTPPTAIWLDHLCELEGQYGPSPSSDALLAQPGVDWAAGPATPAGSRSPLATLAPAVDTNAEELGMNRDGRVYRMHQVIRLEPRRH